MQRLSGLVKLEYDDTQEPVVVNAGGYIDVTINMKDGNSFTRRIDKARGTPEYPLTDEELTDKFNSCAVRTLDPSQVEQAASQIFALDDLSEVRDLMTTIAAPALAPARGS